MLIRDYREKNRFYLCVGGLLVGCLSFFLYKLLVYPLIGYKDLPFYKSAPLFIKEARFSDFFDSIRIPEYPTKAAWAAPPLQHVFYYMLAQSIQILKEKILFFIYTFLGIFFYIYASSSLILKIENTNYTKGVLFKAISILLFFPPLYFAVDRGNIALYVTPLIFLSISFFIDKKYYRSMVFLALATNIKIIPIIFSIMFINKHNIKFFFKFLLLSMIIFCTSFFVLHLVLNYNLSVFREGQIVYANEYAVGNSGLGFSNSIFSLFKIIYKGFQDIKCWFFRISISSLKGYLFFGCLSLLDVIFLYVRNKINLSQLLQITVLLFVLLPHVLADYYLGVLLIPIFLYTFSPKERTQTSKILLVLSILVVIPKAYAWLSAGVSLNVLLNPILLLICYLIIRVDVHINKKK